MKSKNCYFDFYLVGYDLKKDRRYPEMAFNGYTKKEAIKCYKEAHGLKYKRNIIIFEC